MDTERRWQQVVARLGKVPPSPYRYPDPSSAKEPAVDPFVNRADELRVVSGFLEEVVGGPRPVSGVALDAACGQAPYARVLASLFQRVVGVDADAQRVAEGARRAAALPGVRLFPVALTDPVFQEEVFRDAFSHVHCIQVLGHLPPEVAADVLVTLARVLRPTAPAILSVPYTNGPADELWVSRFDELGCQESHRVDAGEFARVAQSAPPGLVASRHFCFPSLDRLVRRAGLTLVQSAPATWYSYTLADLVLLLRR